MFEQRRQQVQERVSQLIARVEELYSLKLPKIDIRFDLRGAAAGIAGYTQGGTQLYMRFNQDMMQNSGWDHLFDNTVPHELAHIVCFVAPRLGRDHDSGWRRVCRALGGNGESRHTQQVTYAKGKTFYYTTNMGHTVAMSVIRHRRIQQGHRYYITEGRGYIDQTCSYSLESN